jgi:hypothetical protein
MRQCFVPKGPQGQKREAGESEVTIDDLIADWRVRSNALNREIAFFETGPGMAPALHLKTLRQMALELDRLIARYARNA